MYVLLTLVLLIWASAFIGIRIGLQAYSPGALALLRFLVASLSMVIIYHGLPNKKLMPWLVRGQLMLLGVGAIGIYNLCLNYGELTVSAGIASFIIGLIPVFTILLSAVFLHEKLSWGIGLGLLISLSGLVIMMLAGKNQEPFDIGILIILISAVWGGIYTVSQKFFLVEYHPVAITSWVIWGGTLMLLWFSPDLWHELPLANAGITWVVIYMGVFPAALAYLGWCYVLSVWSASHVSMYLYALPILSTLMGVLILHEEPSLMALAGAFVALFGAVMANWLRALTLAARSSQTRKIHGIED